MTRTRIVRWLRVLLPLCALVILSTMFLFSRQPDAESQIPYAEVDAEAMAREPRIVAPEYAGVSSDGAELSLRAGQAAPEAGGGGGSASDLRLDWRGPGGLRADLVAPEGGIADGVIALSGGVRMSTSSGWTVESPRIEAATDRSQVVADQGIAATAPFGRITADRMELVQGPPRNSGKAGEGGAGADVLNFSGDVRLIYRPGASQGQ